VAGLRIGLVSDCYHPTKNGVTAVVSGLAAGLEARGHQVVLVAPAPPGRARSRRHLEATLDGFRPADVARRSVPFVPSVELRLAPASARSLARLVEREELDVLHTHTEGTLGCAARKAARLTGTPLVHTLHTFYRHYLHYPPLRPLGPRLAAGVVQHWMARFLLPYDRVIAPSATAADEVRSLLPSKPTVTIPNGVDSRELATPSAVRPTAPLDRATLLYVGRISREKRSRELFACLADQLAARPELRAILVGGGSLLTELRRRALDLGLEHRLLLPGYLRHPEVLAHYRNASLFLTASRSENHPVTLLEAAAAGLPLAVRRDANLGALAREGVTGIEADDDEDLVRRAIELVDAPERRATLGSAARRAARSFGVEVHVERTERLYVELLAGRTAKRGPSAQRTTVRSRT
jgi:1,2-diacylglycerol 3-alpha-glucosyltransferase